MASKMKLAKLRLGKLDLEIECKPRTLTLHDRGYDVEAILGSGTAACVKRVRRREGGNIYAAKCIHDADPEIIAITREEFQILSRLSCSSVVRAISFFEDTRDATLLMELCEGGSLESLVRHRKGLDVSQAKDVCVQLLRGLDYLHCKRIVHRDLKPSNVLFADSQHSEVKIADFNSAKQLSTVNCAMLSHRCTPDYAAPELLLGWIWNERVDIWSLGLCMFFTLQKCLPFNPGSARTQSYFMNFTLPEIDWGEMPDIFQYLILECLVVDMRGRAPAMELLQHPALLCHEDGGLESTESGGVPFKPVARRSWTTPPTDSSSHVDIWEEETNGSDCGSDASSLCALRAMRSDGYINNETQSQGAKNTAESKLQDLASQKMKRNCKPGSTHQIGILSL
eukprot:TRINITY_DN15238_c0_g1_i4.p1 TRINITY_DN15238_c0_g1~~TRINITY_DN15238_c0_g1_i4.p1  ORF type:complete len:396 (+),score=64.91 TRINITY_DN15238_c0_g1_i4:111-1298(+)